MFFFATFAVFMGGCFWIRCLLKRDFFEIWRVLFFLTEREREGEIMNNGLVLGATSCWATSKTSKGPFDRLVGGHLIFEPTINWFRGYSFIFRNVRQCGESPFVFFETTPSSWMCLCGDFLRILPLDSSPWLGEYMGVSLNGATPKTPQNDHF